MSARASVRACVRACVCVCVCVLWKRHVSQSEKREMEGKMEGRWIEVVSGRAWSCVRACVCV